MIKKQTKSQKSTRLANQILPTHYNLTILPDILASTFSGNEIIKIKVTNKTKTITLHSKDIDVEIAKFKNKKIEQFASKINYNIKKETVILHFKDEILIGQGKLSLTFSGIINSSLRGFYKSKYVLGGEEKYIATTQFESTDARRAFPCFDEPAIKAIFEISLIIPDNHTAISNTLPVSIKEHTAGYKIVSFEPTPIMSTYLLAYIIGEFEYIEGYTKDKVQVRVFTTKGKIHQAKFALETAIKSLEFYNEYFNIPYPLRTLDLIAIPDFESAAMENWGAVTFRETAILVDEEHTSLSNKQWAAIVIAHELAHQWFGNLVTMHWWTDLWLNEGFASYMENYCVDHMFPDWHIWDLYLSDRYALALRLDSLKNSHPIEVEVNHPDEISEIFDMVSYAKGSAVIRMLAEYLGDDKFRDGLRHYLKKHSYKNTQTIDLWNSFEKISKKTIVQIMNSWTKETGYPLLSVSKKNNQFYLNQERFFSSRISALSYSNSNKKKSNWQIPVKYESLTTKSDNMDILKLLLTQKSAPLIGTSIGKINKDEETFARVHYDIETLNKLSAYVTEGKLSVKDRLGLIRDVFALAEGGYIETTEALEFSLAYKNETEYIVWSEISQGVNKIANIIGSESFKEKYNQYVRSLFSPLAEKVGFDHIKGENHSNTFLRSLSLSMAAHYGDMRVIRQAHKLFKNRSKSTIRADIRGLVYNIVAANGKNKEWNLFEKLYLKEEFHEEKDRYARALASFKDTGLILKTLNFAMSEKVRNQDAPQIITQIWQKYEGRDLTWKFIKNNWTNILQKFGDGGLISRLIVSLGNHTKIKDLNDAKKFFTKNVAPGAERELTQIYEKIESNIAWLKDDKKPIKEWLNKNY